MTDRRLAYRKLLADESGQTTVEWTLLLVVFALPMYLVFKMLVDVLAAHYRMVTFMETLPFP
ncbi:MAG: Flp family type IVb pilin [Planctomycetota bacterium]|jgi:Flp pilus assembly pilin Flp